LADRIQDRLDWKTYDPNLISDAKKLAKNFPKVRQLQEVATLNEEYKSPSSFEDEEVKLIRVKLHGFGAELRETKKVRSISGPLARVKKGNIILSRIDCTQGAVAIVPDDLDGGVVSKEFFLIDVNEEEYSKELLVRLLLHKRYVQYLLSYRTGATNRLRLDKDILLSLPIPNIKRVEQEKILSSLKEIETRLQYLKSLSDDATLKAGELIHLARKDILKLASMDRLSELQATAESWHDDLSSRIEEALQ